MNLTLPTVHGRRPTASHRGVERALRAEVQAAVSQLLDDRHLLAPGPAEEAQIRTLIRERIAAYQRRAATTNTAVLIDPDGVDQRLFDGLLRLGVLQPYMEDPAIEEIICNGPSRVFVIEDGRKRLLPDVYLDDDAELLALIKRLIGPLGRRLDESSPLVDARLPDGSRLNAAISPATTGGCALTLRKFILRATSLDRLVALETLSESAAQFLDAAVQGGLNILVSGPTGSGKTTFLNALGTSIASPDERIVTVEEVAELQLARQLPDCVALQARAANVEGVGEIRIRELVKNALRMRPTRIIVGEVRSGEALDMLLAMNTGHDGSMTTIHGSSPRDALDRLITLAMMAGERLSDQVVTKMVAHTIELVVQLRFEPASGRRRVVSIYEVTGMETTGGDSAVITGNELWTLDAQRDRLTWTGLPPRCLGKITAKGVRYALPMAVGSQE
jgi:pilus assembly protein CpaF